MLNDTCSPVDRPQARPANYHPKHGGDIVSASAHYGIPLEDWLDLSTGINPESYPVNIPVSAFEQLPYVHPEFIVASAHYYRSSQMIPVAGTQAAIQQLPYLLDNFPVLIPQTGYQEHREHWQIHGASICEYPSLHQAEMIAFIDQALQAQPQQHLVVINPNNPTGVLLEKAQLLTWAKQLAHGAYLIVDEAFIDIFPEHSVLDAELAPNVIVLRSFGKFFGLAGIRLGYCFADTGVLNGLRNRLGLWQVNGPAQVIATQALQDKAWQAQAMENIQKQAALMQHIFSPLMKTLTAYLMESVAANKTNLFLSYAMRLAQAQSVSDYFARSGVLLRVVDLGHGQGLLRIGLCDSSYQERLESLVSACIGATVDTTVGTTVGMSHV